jgi:tripartite-type tricarboxylate transporter receptor subunit TctC
MNRRAFIATGAAVGVAGCQPARQEAMRIVVGSGAGSASDGLARIFAGHLARLGVTATVEDQPAAGGKLAARRLSKAAPSDDIMAFVPTGLLYSTLLGEEGVDWDMATFSWLGSFSKDRRALVVTRQAMAERFEDLLTRPKPLILAATAAASPGFYEPMIIRHLTGANLKVVPGFEGGARNLALVSGEAQGVAGSLDGLQPVLDLPGARIVLRINDLPLIHGQEGAGRDDPALRAFAKGNDATPLLDLVNAHAEFGRIVALPPGAPVAKLALWRSRTAAVMADADFRRDAAAAGFVIEPTAGEAVSARLTALLSYGSTPIRAALKRALTATGTV